ncbi:uncharacterized protein LOC111394066 [Olea europaea subsp. europaea]|uniref:Uncharacterized protein LOC111394066 n=1 Tax=Olea europaea subsp. europaea TaxID=158383 RepID=A0A8S0S970_OLEEU|nr:uncharacterized protein LOC111394066 [Olea europaea subsp. europaea]
MSRPKDPKFSDSPSIPTNLSHVVFGIAGSAKTWRNRRWYVETWWRPNITRGYIFMDIFPRKFLPWPPSSPPFRIYQDTSRYKKYDKHPIPQAIRMTHIILETFKAENKGVRWYVLADDDTVFFINNLVDVLAKYDHNKYFYIGMNSESHASNVYHSFNMAFGGAGYALSFPLAEALVNNLDMCIKRYPTLYGSDHILQSCVADLGVSLTPEKGFHQVDVHGDISGLLSAHPQSPLVSLHHLDYINPIFPYMNQYKSLSHLMEAAKTDESRLLQQSICYHKPKNWSFSLSWGYSVQLYESIFLPSMRQRPLQTFTPWSKSVWPLFLFNTRIPSRNPCEAPNIFFFDSVANKSRDYFVTSYIRRRPPCSSMGNHSANNVSKIYVLSPSWKHDPIGSRRECCDVMHITGTNTTEIKLRSCLEDEIVP